MAKKRKTAYAQAGVDIEEMNRALKRVKALVDTTRTRGVLSGIGSFGGLFSAPGRDHILVASTDGVGTKLNVAARAGRHDTVGQDLVNHCVNDILAQGARPLFFMDYLGTSQLTGTVFEQVVAGLARACRENGCALLGGETAEMPGLYPKGEYDLVGTIVGTVPKRDLITGQTIREGDILIGLPSTGLHTNGYSLARKIVFDTAGLGLNDLIPGTRRTVASALLAVHRSYLNPVQTLLRTVRVRGIAHITGGGLTDNLPRILPDTLGAVIDCSTWKTPPIFRFLQQTGNIDTAEMYHVFNMGIGMVLVVRPKDADKALTILRRARAAPRIIGRIQKGAGVQLENA